LPFGFRGPASAAGPDRITTGFPFELKRLSSWRLKSASDRSRVLYPAVSTFAIFAAITFWRSAAKSSIASDADRDAPLKIRFIRILPRAIAVPPPSPILDSNALISRQIPLPRRPRLRGRKKVPPARQTLPHVPSVEINRRSDKTHRLFCH